MRPLDRLLRPKSIAVIGGGAWCENVLRECRKFGFEGDLWAVHPKRQDFGGVPAYRSVRELPYVPDAAFIGVNRHATVEIVRELAEAGAGGAICFASGFREAIAELADGGDLQAELVEAAGDMPFLGPNCYGLLNATNGAAIWPDRHGLLGVPRGVAILSQSSNIALNLTMQTRGLPIACLVTVGNQAQTGLSKIGEALLEDERITAIGLHIEGIDDLKAFERFAREARRKGKPVVALKVGKSEQAQAAAISHTASLAGSTAGSDALMTRLGVAQVHSLPALLETLKILHVTGGLPDGKLVSVSCSGGEASLIADMAHHRKLSFPPLSSTQKERLADVLGPKVALANPLDYHTYIWGDAEATARMVAAMMAGEASLGIVILDFPRPDRCTFEDWFKVIDAAEAAQRTSGKPVAVVSTLGETMPESIAVDLMARGLIPLAGLDEALAAIEAVAAIAGPLPEEEIFFAEAPAEPTLLSEHAAKAVLSEFGLSIPKSSLAEGADAAAATADEIGYPVVLKGTGSAHKSDIGAVALNLRSADEVRAAAARMPETRFLVEEMVTGALAEILIGVVRDPAHGYVLTLAAGGVLTELLTDCASLLVPVSREQVKAALGELRLAPVLGGYRGRPAADMEKIVDAVMAVQACVLRGNVAEIEVNPLLCGPDFAVAADALIRWGEEHDG
ncbi:acetate--CoA ligase family protein [Roseibium aggregatum]|uniref:Acetate--CoA ligase family protein n=1 Tax=Roseibium aggregatum TaxID=187304 RepID=A0A939EL41_9HYPH|nr:acetate--CoA ligase family protein [Roseibium aggregatum]MBN9673764.1 acetate--CoA ligase family protein [Roseibium aggregatum]